MGDAPAMSLKRIECRTDKAVIVVIRPDPFLGNSVLLHMDCCLPIERIGIAMRKILGVAGRINGYLLPEGEADRLAVEETSKGIAHAANIA
jgi:hypothetical protein